MRKPGPATSTRSTPAPSRACSAAASRSATARGGALTHGGQQQRGVRRVVAEVGALRALEGRAARRPGARPRRRRRRRRGRRRAGRREGSPARSVMVGLARQDLVGPVELLEQHDARELVREGQRPERQPVVQRSSAIPNGPPTTKQTSRPACRRSSTSAAKRSESYARPPRSSRQTHARVGDAPRERGVVAHLDLVDAGVPGEELRVVRDVVGVGRAQASHRQDRVAHRCDTTRA